jgi:flagellar FliJ protein
MPFRFALQPVLHLRQSLEHQQELRLRTANQQVARVRHLIEQLDAHRNDLDRQRSQELGAGTTAAEMRFELQREVELLRHRRELEQQLARLQQMRDQQRAALRQARQAREMLESLRERQFEAYRNESARREQRNVDDLFLLRKQYLARLCR